MARKRSRLQFSMRTAMLFVLICAIPCSWLATRMLSVRRQREAYTALRARGWGMLYDYQCHIKGGLYDFQPNPHPPGSAWLRAILGERFFADVAWVGPSNGNCGDAELKFLEQVPHCRYLELQYDATDSALVHLRGMKELDKLDLNHSSVTDAGMRHLENLHHLRVLRLSHTKISDAGLIHLTSLPLDDLDLSETKVGDVGLQRLRPLLPRLRWLELAGTRITDAGLLELPQAAKLEYLTLIGTNVTDSGLSSLVGLKHLTYLDLSETRVTKNGFNRLQQALPGVFIATEDPQDEDIK